MKVSTVFIATISVASLILSVSALAKKPTAVAEKEQQIQQIQGLNGSNGKDGLNGLNGLDGRDGRDGRDGKDGKDGIDGKDGTNGYTPYIGDNGNWFINGEDTGYFAGIKLPEEFEEKEEEIEIVVSSWRHNVKTWNINDLSSQTYCQEDDYLTYDGKLNENVRNIESITYKFYSINGWIYYPEEIQIEDSESTIFDGIRRTQKPELVWETNDTQIKKFDYASIIEVSVEADFYNVIK